MGCGLENYINLSKTVEDATLHNSELTYIIENASKMDGVFDQFKTVNAGDITFVAKGTNVLGEVYTRKIGNFPQEFSSQEVKELLEGLREGEKGHIYFGGRSINGQTQDVYVQFSKSDGEEYKRGHLMVTAVLDKTRGIVIEVSAARSEVTKNLVGEMNKIKEFFISLGYQVNPEHTHRRFVDID